MIPLQVLLACLLVAVAETVVAVGGGAGFGGGGLTAFAGVGAMGEVCRSAGCCTGSRVPRH